MEYYNAFTNMDITKFQKISLHVYVYISASGISLIVDVWLSFEYAICKYM